MRFQTTVLKSIDVRAIIWGCLTDFGCTFFFGLCFTLVASMRAALKGVDLQSLQPVLESWAISVHGMIFSLFFGLFFTGVGGYVAARKAKRGGLINSAFVGSIGIVSGLFFIEATPVVITLVALTLSIPIAIIGGYCHTMSWKW
jgi:hypothetical protein